MERETTLSEEQKDRAVVHYDLILRLKEDRGFKMLLGYLQEDAHNAMHEFKRANPEDPANIRDLQNRIWRYEELLNTIDFIINLGEAVKTERTLEQEGE